MGRKVKNTQGRGANHVYMTRRWVKMWFPDRQARSSAENTRAVMRAGREEARVVRSWFRLAL